MPSQTIRRTVPSDVEAIAQIAEATGLFPGDMLGGMIAGFFQGGKDDIWLTVIAGGEAMAFAFCEPERLTQGTWNLLAIGVLPGHQGQGVGALLLHHLENVLRQAGHRVLLVETLGTPEFARTRSFYLANGFTEEARIRDFYEAGGDKVIFWKRL